MTPEILVVVLGVLGLAFLSERPNCGWGFWLSAGQHYVLYCRSETLNSVPLGYLFELVHLLHKLESNNQSEPSDGGPTVEFPQLHPQKWWAAVRIPPCHCYWMCFLCIAVLVWDNRLKGDYIGRLVLWTCDCGPKTHPRSNSREDILVQDCAH